jgi:2-(1,2-epoxy-1,2-dihydrophenyl)acetyl-CoA isomerase
VESDEAARIGLATEVVADDAFIERVRAYAAQLAMGAPIAQALTKRMLVRSLDTELDAALREELVNIKQCFTTRDVGEAIAAFREKRRPHFTGE